MSMQDANATPSMKEAAHWHKEIEQCESDRREWLEKSRKIIKRFRDERADKDNTTSTRRMNLLWSNVQTLAPAVYGKTPEPIAERRYKDKDPVGRAASMILERSLRYEMEPSGFDCAADLSVQDYLLPGRGVMWVRYVPQFGESLTVSSDNDSLDAKDGAKDDRKGDEEDLREVISEGLEVDYIQYKDFYHSRARYWAEVQKGGWVAKRVFMGRKALKKRFGSKIGEAIPLTHSPAGKDDQHDPKDAENTQAIIFEIWDSEDRQVIWIAKDYPECCDKKADPLKLRGFFPCPEPLFATMTSDTLIPVPDFQEYQDQADEIDSLTNRISMLAKALKAAGVYAAAEKALSRLLEEGTDNTMIPVDQWAMFAEKGGLAGVMSFLPIKEVAEVLVHLTEARKTAKEDLYEVTGIADIIRGQGDANETATAQKIKSSHATLRLKSRQDQVARFMRDTIEIMGEIIAEHFSPETLIEVSGAMFDDGMFPMELMEPPKPPQPAAPMPQPAMPPGAGQPAPMPQPQLPPGAGQPAPMPGMMAPPPPVDPQIVKMMQEKAKLQFLMKAIDLLKNDKMRGFRIDIETDSTIQADEAQEKADRIEFITATTKFLEAAGQISAAEPAAMPLLTKMLAFGVRGFRVGRDLESAIDEFVDKMDQKARELEANPQAKQDPEMMKAQAEIERQKIENEGEAANNAANLQMKQIDQQTAQIQAAADIRKTELEEQIAIAQHGREMEKMQMDRQMQQQQMAMDAHHMQQEAELGHVEHHQKMELGAAQHQQKKEQIASQERIGKHKEKQAMKPKEKAA